MAENDQDSRLGLHNKQHSSGQKGGAGHGHPQERQYDSNGNRSPISVRRTPISLSKKQTTMNIRKLTNSLFDEGALTEQCNVIKEEEKERDEQD